MTLIGCSAPARPVSTAAPSTAATATAPAGGPATTAQAHTPATSSGPAVTTPASTATTMTRTTSTTKPPGAAPAQFAITSADSGTTVTMRVGDTLRLVLDDTAMQWTNLNETQPGLLRADPAPAPPPHGQLAIWTAVQKGVDTVSSTGTAFCPAGTACPMFARLFQMTIQVS